MTSLLLIYQLSYAGDRQIIHCVKDCTGRLMMASGLITVAVGVGELYFEPVKKNNSSYCIASGSAVFIAGVIVCTLSSLEERENVIVPDVQMVPPIYPNIELNMDLNRVRPHPMLDLIHDEQEIRIAPRIRAIGELNIRNQNRVDAFNPVGYPSTYNSDDGGDSV